MLLSNVIAVQYQDIQDVDGADFSLGFPLGRVIHRLATQTVAISALIYSLVFDRTSFSSNKKSPFQILEANKFPVARCTVTCHHPQTGVSRLHSFVSGKGERAGPQLPSPVLCALSGATAQRPVHCSILLCSARGQANSQTAIPCTVTIPQESFPQGLQWLLSTYVPKEPQNTWSHLGNVICCCT